VTAVERLVISRLLNFAAGLERVYDPFLFPVLGAKESIKKGKTISRINLQFTFIKSIYNVDLFIYSFYILKFLTVFRKKVETGMDPRLICSIYFCLFWPLPLYQHLDCCVQLCSCFMTLTENSP